MAAWPIVMASKNVSELNENFNKPAGTVNFCEIARMSAANEVSKESIIDKRTRLLVFGFVRESQELLAATSALRIIPDEVTNICLKAYWMKFIFESDFDENGIMYYLGTSYIYGKNEWINPVTKRLEMKSSEWEGGDINDIVGRTFPDGCHSWTVSNSWFSIELSDELKINVMSYSLRHDDNDPNGNYMSNFLRNWNFEGSNDGSKWITLMEHKNDESLNEKHLSHTWHINPDNSDVSESYKMFRIYTTGPDSDADFFLCCGGFEIYGHL